MTTSEKPETNMDALLGHAMDKPVPVEVRERMHRRLADFRERFEAEPVRAGFWTRLSAIPPRAKAVVLAATAAGLAVAAGIAALMIFSARPAYALDQTIQALKQVGFMHIIQRGADGTLADERWIEIGPDGRHQARYRQDTPRGKFFVVDDQKTVLVHYKDKNTVVLCTPAQQRYTWIWDLGEFFKDFQNEGNVVIEPNVQFRGHRAHLVRWLKLNAEAYIDPDTKLPLSLMGYDVSYEAPPAGTFDIVIPKGVLVVDKRPGAPPVEEPQWMKDQEAAPARFDEAKAALAAGDYEKGERLCAETVTLEPRTNWAWFWLGYAQSKQAKYDQAIASYTKVIEMFGPEDTVPHYAYLARGLAYRARGMEDRAKQDLAVALPIMIDVLRHPEGALLFNEADDPLFGKQDHRPTPEESKTRMYGLLRLATGQAPVEATASDEQRIVFWENWWKVHAAEYGVVTRQP